MTVTPSNNSFNDLTNSSFGGGAPQQNCNSDGEEDVLEFDLWEGLVSLSDDTPTSPDGEGGGAEGGVAKAIKNAKNQQKV